MKFISWNVNGIRAAMGKGLPDFFQATQPDIFCLQETKAHPDQVEMPWAKGYHALWNSAVKRGYSGTLILTREEPLNVTNGLGIMDHDQEGRVITAEYPDFYVVNVYTPNSQNELRRLDYRQLWDRDFLAYVRRLEQIKPVILCGDLNVAHTEIDIARPKENRRNAGFTDEERAGFDNIVNAGFIDTFRHFRPDEPGHYSWWSFRANARANNVGWRIDYFCVSSACLGNVKSAGIYPDIMGSDHCPVELVLG